MDARSRKWIVKDAAGRIFGPFDTEKILRQIEKGYFSGGEMVAPYPGGQWVPISREPEFYDKLLDVLAAETNGRDLQVADANARDMDTDAAGDAAFASAVSRGRLVSEGEEDDEDEKDDFVMTPIKPAAEASSQPSSDSNPVIELADVESLMRKEKMRLAKIPLLLIATALVLVAIYIGIQDPPKGRIHLLAPRKGQPELPDAKVKEKFLRALKAFQQDTYSGYIRAQNEFVQLVEGAPRNAEVHGLLCLTYRELWPYASQDSRDQAVLKLMTVQTRQLDPVGVHGARCEVVGHLLTGRTAEARGLLQQQFATANGTEWADLREMYAELSQATGNLMYATEAYKSARELWPQWLKPWVAEARARVEQKQFAEAMSLYRTVLKMNPAHPAGRIELGLIEFDQFNHPDEAYELIRGALDSGERMQKSVESNGWLGLSRIHLKRNEKQKALEYARRSYSVNPGNAASKKMVIALDGVEGLKNTKIEHRELLYLGDQYAKAGDHFAAQAEYKAAFDHDPKNGTAALKAAKSLWQLNQSVDAIDWLNKAIAADPKLTSAYVTLADYHSQRFDYLEAVRILKKSQSLDPRSYEVWRGYAMVELRRNNPKGAIGFAQKALELYNTDTETYNILAESNLKLQNYPDAFRYAKGALELESDNIEAQTLFAKVRASYEGPDAGIQYLDERINSYPGIVEYRLAKGDILAQELRIKEAEEEFRKIVSIEPSNKKAFLALGRILAQQPHRIKDALEIFLRAAKLDPSDANPLFLTGMLYFEQKDWNSAAIQFERVLRTNARYPLAHYYVGKSALEMGQHDRALQEAHAERAVNPDLADAYILAAEAYVKMGQHANCAGEYQKAVAKRPQGSEIYVKMAQCYRLSGALDSAASLLRQAASIESGNANIYKEQGALYQMQGQTVQALEAYNQYLLLSPGASDRSEIESAISQLQ